MTQPIPTPEESNRQHTNSDKNSSRIAQHHSLGIGSNEASPGDHIHDGKTSKRIGKGLDPAFPSDAAAAYSEAQIQSIIDALRDLGFGT